MSLTTREVTLQITYNDELWPDPAAWDWAELIGDVWRGPVEDGKIRLAAMHLPDKAIPWEESRTDR